jgi:dTDP-4-amino-4,6-dideoxygalactose transaminase
MDMHVPFFDLRVQDESLRKELLDAADTVLQHGKLILGPEVEQLEAAVAKESGTQYAIGVASGSSALYLALKASGIGPGDEVITTPLTWIITLNAIAECGATPICVDIREDFNIDPDAVENAVTEKTKAIVPVHFTGKVCEMDRIVDIAKCHNLQIVEDAAQAFKGTYKGQIAGTFSTAAGLSMNAMKVLAGYGESGMVVTNDPEVNERVRIFRYAGTKSDPKKIITNECLEVSLNHKIDTLQAAMLLVALKHLPAKMERRRIIAQHYNKAFADLDEVLGPVLEKNEVHALYTYAIQADRRDDLMNYLHARQIENKIYHVPLASVSTAHAGSQHHATPVAERVLSRFLSLPAHEKVSDEQMAFVSDTVREFYRS